jgi:hypothetical protein
MQTNPFKFDSNNPRLVANAERSQNVILGTAVIFLASLQFYNRRFFRKDGNLLNMLAFTAASVPAAYSYSSFAFSTPETEAALLNNQNERTH